MLTVVAVLRVCVCVRGVCWVLVVLCVRWGVVVVMVMVGGRVLLHLAVLGVVAVQLCLSRVDALCRVVEVGWVGLVGDEGGVTGRRNRRVALRRGLPSLAAE